jgi:hypothetical protein
MSILRGERYWRVQLDAASAAHALCIGAGHDTCAAVVSLGIEFR